jgi:DNA-directed RNA polymerase II subunit RPB2
MDNQTLWKIIHSHFNGDHQCLVRHHIESYNDFYTTGIFQIFKEKNPITINSMYDESIQDFRHQCHLYLGGKNGDKVYFGKPVIYDEDNSHYMFPNEARLRNMTYGMTIHYDVDIEFIDILKPGETPYVIEPEMVGGENNGINIDALNPDYSTENKEYKNQTAGNFKSKKTEDYTEDDKKEMQNTNELEGGAPKKVERKKRYKTTEVEMTTAMAAEMRDMYNASVVGENKQIRTMTLNKIFLGKFPIMVQSKFCILNGLSRDNRFNVGECKNDLGGYFIIDGKEKTVVPQEKFGDNMLYIRKSNDGKHLYSAEIKSVSENVSKPIRTLAVRIVAPTSSYSFKNIVVNIPNVKKAVPLFIVFRALGVISDKSIITMCLLDIEKYENMLDLFIPSVHDAGGIMTQVAALEYIAKLTKFGTISYTMEILTDYFLPHIGETNFIQKSYYLGYIVFKLLSVYSGIEQPTDRDNFKFKRVELVGSLLYDLFREYYTIQQKQIHLGFEEKLYYNKTAYTENLVDLINKNYIEVFRERHVDLGFKKAFKGNWGSTAHTKRIGVVQDLNRLSFNTAISHLRKTNLPLDSGVKLVGPRMLNGSQWGFIDPIDTPDGANIGLHKSLALSTYITRGYSREKMLVWLREKLGMKLVEDCGPLLLASMTKVFVNGYWAGALFDPFKAISEFKLYRRNSLIPIHTSINFDIKSNIIWIYTDAGRVSRPIFYIDEETKKPSFSASHIMKYLKSGDFTWEKLTTGFNEKRINNLKNIMPDIYELYQLYEGINSETNPAKLERFLTNKAIIDYIDPSESENTYIALKAETNKFDERHTHIEIHESLIFGVMCNLIVFPENNPPTRDAFSCGQSKQAVSMYHTNYQVRMDKAAVILNNGQIPLVKSRYLEHINNEENTYGENAIVAIMCYTGYNMEDSILVNEGSIKRGMFNTTYYTVYEVHEEKSIIGSSINEKIIGNIEAQEVIGKKKGYDYSKLDKFGLVREGTIVDEKTILIGLTSNISGNPGMRMDHSKSPKKGQVGIVDKAFITESAEGKRIAKIRIRDIRIPNLGDKMASRAGQKGTCGNVIPECDMPFTKDGIRPDLIINPHAIPTRMTIGHLVECLMGKTCAIYGGFGDCTAFNNKGSKIGIFGDYLARSGFHSSGNEIMYNGMTGEQIEMAIYIGPTYYMRLKHMVKDKINYRARGPNTQLTKQPVAGRANDGGLRIGEMERDVLISHGITAFLNESMLHRADDYSMAICNKTGMMAVYNPSKNLFLSPMADGPLRFVDSFDGKSMGVENISRFGRDFSIVRVPYSLKLLLQELMAINVQMRIITDDNIDQLENLSFSNNISLLTNGALKTPSEVIEKMKTILSGKEAVEKVLKVKSPASSELNTSPEESLIEYNPDKSVSIPETPESISFNDLNEDATKEIKNNYIRENTEVDLLKGGQNDDIFSKPEYTVGDKVYYRSDIVPMRVWNIKDAGNGNEFLTIDTDDLRGIDDISDTIKVVSGNDIYKVNSIVNGGGFTPIISNNSIDNTPYIMPMNGSTPVGIIPGGINVNPIIKIVNGPDNSIDTNNPEPNYKHDNNIIPNTEFINTSDLLQFGGGKVNINKNEENSKNEISSNENKIEDMSKIDFNKLVIKKV